MQEDIKKVIEVAEGAEDHPVAPSDGTVTVSTGVVFGTRKIPSTAFGDLLTRFPDPKVPKIPDPERGRVLENPAHPDYIQAKQENETRRSMAALDLAIIRGTECISAPEGMLKQDDPDWLEQMELLGYGDITTKKAGRYLLWVKFIAAPDDADVAKLLQTVMRRMGVLESDVQNAFNSFPNKAK